MEQYELSTACTILGDRLGKESSDVLKPSCDMRAIKEADLASTPVSKSPSGDGEHTPVVTDVINEPTVPSDDRTRTGDDEHRVDNDQPLL